MNTENITINEEQKLYVFNIGNGFSCLGFDICENRKAKLAIELGKDILPTKKGTIESYKEYDRLISIASEKNRKTGWKSKSELIPEFIGKEGERVEIVDQYGEKRRFYIGKSTGFIPCHLEILRSNSSGGGSVTGYPFKSLVFLAKKR
jgi:hypothetical protein